MMVIHPPKTLQMLIKETWLLESIKNLGGGYCTHLAYLNEDIDPEVSNDIKNHNFPGVLGEIIKIDNTSNRRVARVEVNQINDFRSFIRFDLRLLEITPFFRATCTEVHPNFLCYYQSVRR